MSVWGEGGRGRGKERGGGGRGRGEGKEGGINSKEIHKGTCSYFNCGQVRLLCPELLQFEHSLGFFVGVGVGGSSCVPSALSSFCPCSSSIPWEDVAVSVGLLPAVSSGFGHTKSRAYLGQNSRIFSKR